MERRRRGRGAPSNDAEGMGAMTRRRRRRGDDDEDDGEGGDDNKKVDDNEDAADGKQKREKMDAETRRRAMRGGKVIEDEKVCFCSFVALQKIGYYSDCKILICKSNIQKI